MKKVLPILLAGSLLFTSGLFVKGSSATAASSTGKIEVLLDAKKIQFPDAQPYQDAQGSVMVPIRFVSEALGAEVGWEKVNGHMSVSVKNGDHIVDMTVGQEVAKVDGKDKSYGTKIELKQNRTFVPLRLVSEGLGQTVEWDKVGRWVWIGKKEALTLEEAGLKPVSIEPYKKYFAGKPALLMTVDRDAEYSKAVIFKTSDLPTAFIGDIYSMDYYVEKDGSSFIKVRAKTNMDSPGNIFFLSNDGKPRYRNPVFKKTINNNDGTKIFYYPILSFLDELDGIKNYKTFKIKDAVYIGFSYANKNYIPLLKNPWADK
ncbi:copper amine oxidase N-terminal domain-containing protein [Paenibacillus sp. HJL G12]|uniref:Copper amine oxidase N-terminal domain-containing protein n=1 Tax=Paenibacillus dendrobii TaxID=2691084 RepID=A0A7X3LI11_9BACL|nr:copper amine oxidase N-terminal domain-containing protein [Paenibacillus dendrobii]MWV44108.1 copper amine oxidase N-terminal domain-containing protein [Paenibacillus dendrobii]